MQYLILQGFLYQYLRKMQEKNVLHENIYFFRIPFTIELERLVQYLKHILTE